MENQTQFNSWKDTVEDCELKTQIDCLRILELNISNVCNLKCSYCPQAYGWNSPTTKFISNAVVDEICKQLKSFDYKGYICIAGHGEPTLHKDLINILQKLSCFNVVLVTNGLLLDAKTWEHISTLCQIKVSVHDWKNKAQFEQKFKNTNAWLRNHDVENPQMYLYNRAGFLNVPESRIETPCHYPFYKVMVDSDGTYAICEADWKRKSNTAYTVFDCSIEEYFVNKLDEKREAMICSQGRQNCESCKTCDIIGTLVGSKFVEFWKANKAK